MLGIDLKAARTMWTYSSVLLLIYMFYVVRKTLLVFVLSLLFAYLLIPIVDWIYRKLGWKSRIPAIVIPYAILIGMVAFFIWRIKAPMTTEFQQLVSQIGTQDFRNKLESWTPLGIPLGHALVENYTSGKIQQELEKVIPTIRAGLPRALRDLGNFFIVPILAFFMLKDGRVICDRLIEFCMDGERDSVDYLAKRRTIENISRDAHAMILQYMRALLFLCLATLIIFTLVFRLIRLKYGILLALISFPLEFVPLAGPLVQAIIIIGVSEFERYAHVGWVIAFLFAFRLFQDYVLSPHLMKKGVALHPLLVLFGVFVGGDIGSVGGIFLSVPILALLRLIYYEARKQKCASPEAVEAPESELASNLAPSLSA